MIPWNSASNGGFTPPIVIPVVLIIVQLLGVIAVLWKKRKERELFDTDFLAFFYMGMLLIAMKVVIAIVVNMGWVWYPVMDKLIPSIGTKN